MSRKPVQGKTGRSTTVMIDGSGVFTTEGNVAGDRAGRLTKARDEQRQQFADKRAAIEKEHRKASVAKVDDKFNAASDAVELNFKSSTVGLVNLKDYVALSKKRDADEEAGCVCACVCVAWRCWCRGGGLRGVGGGRGVVGGVVDGGGGRGGGRVVGDKKAAEGGALVAVAMAMANVVCFVGEGPIEITCSFRPTHVRDRLLVLLRRPVL